MKTKVYLKFNSMLFLTYLILMGCSSDQEIGTVPTVETLEISDVTSTTASSGGVIIDIGGTSIIDKGLCWDLKGEPTIALPTRMSVGPGSEPFIGSITGLVPNRKYFLRAYATNSTGTSYGNEITFITDAGSNIIHKVDGRNVVLGDPSPLPLDLSMDGHVDFTIFLELTANSLGDHLYVGVNPIGPNLVKSGPPIDNHFLNMGFLSIETTGSVIGDNLQNDQRWTSDHAALIIRNTSSSGEVSYEGSSENPVSIVGIQHKLGNLNYYGWLRIKFDKATEVVTLLDYAYNSLPDHSIVAGKTANEN